MSYIELSYVKFDFYLFYMLHCWSVSKQISFYRTIKYYLKRWFCAKEWTGFIDYNNHCLSPAMLTVPLQMQS